MAPSELVALEIRPWGGPRALPLWLPPQLWGMVSRDVRPSLDAGLRCRPLDDVVAGALDHEQRLGLDRPRKAGLSATEEAEVLAAV